MSQKRPQTKFNGLFLSDIIIYIPLGKEYSSEEEQLRFSTFFRNAESIESHNNEAEAGNFTHRLGINQFSRSGRKLNQSKELPAKSDNMTC